ncbi:MAG: 50S ribosomal protein L17 [Bacteroidetes bacterium]|nr:50S ribosomal protein L17 [Bacteroidota bacterium]NCQ11992.1 50S ribosomal protein L17 [Bacteroidota bacterium]
MRHSVKGRKLGRTSAHRKSTMRALSIALLKHHRIVTTLAKAKELRRYVEPVITRAKDDNHHNRNILFSFLHNKEAIKELFATVMPVVGERPGGYTRVIRVGNRPGDGAEMAIIELVDFNDVKPEGAKASKKRRTRRGSKKAKADETTNSSDISEN